MPEREAYRERCTAMAQRGSPPLWVRHVQARQLLAVFTVMERRGWHRGRHLAGQRQFGAGRVAEREAYREHCTAMAQRGLPQRQAGHVQERSLLGT